MEIIYAILGYLLCGLFLIALIAGIIEIREITKP
jgi:hypothetical protein